MRKLPDDGHRVSPASSIDRSSRGDYGIESNRKHFDFIHNGRFPQVRKTPPTQPRLLVLTSTLPRFVGDPEPAFVLHLAEALSDRFQVTLLAPMDPDASEYERIGGVTIHRYRYAPLRSWETLAYPRGIMPRLRSQPWRWLQVPLLIAGLTQAIRSLHRTHDFDLVHCHWVIPQGLAALLALPRAGRPPLVVTSHGGDLHTLAHGPARPLLRRVLRDAAGITVVSIPLLGIVSDLTGGDPGNLAMIPMGVDIERFAQVRPAPSWAEDHGLRRPVILFVGRLAEKKGVSYLLDAVGHPALAGLDYSVAIIGDGPLRAELERRCRTQGLQDRVRFLGPWSYARIPEAMASADLLVAPSVRASDGDCEGLPTVILEAMASGLAVVSTPVGGITQVIRDRETGRLVPERDSAALAQALTGLLRDPAERRHLARNGRVCVQEFDWRHIADRYAAVLDQAAASTTGQPSTTAQ